MSKNFSGKFYLFYRIYYTEILSTKMSVRLFGVDSFLVFLFPGLQLPELLPAQQGLKLCKRLSREVGLYASRITSSTTRIETYQH